MQGRTKLIGGTFAGLVVLGLIVQATGLTDSAAAPAPAAQTAPAPSAPAPSSVPVPEPAPASEAPAWPAPEETTPAPTPEETTPATPAYFAPEARDFSVILYTTRSRCFGVAGCNITYRPSLSLTRPGYPPNELDPSITYEVTFKVLGDENGPQIDTLTWTGRMGELRVQESYASTVSNSVYLIGVVTDVQVQR